MKYIIDANNLAGKLDLLRKDDFDNLLIEKVKEFFGNNSCPVFLVFDSVDPMGDKYREGNIEIIYTPRDNYYGSADNRILELVREQDEREQVVAVTDDRGLSEKIKECDRGNRITIKKATDVSKKMRDRVEEEEKGDKEKLSDQEVKEINQELLDKFKNQ